MDNVEQMINEMVEVSLPQGEHDFFRTRETLTRIGIANKNNELFQSCHILQKRGKYYIVHFKELFMLDGKESNFTDEDKARRNTIANLLVEWKLVELVDSNKTKDPVCPLSKIKVISFDEKRDGKWTLRPKYKIGSKKKKVDNVEE